MIKNTTRYAVIWSSNTDPTSLIGSYSTQEKAIEAMIADIAPYYLEREDWDKMPEKRRNHVHDRLLNEYLLNQEINLSNHTWYYILEIPEPRD